MHMKNKNYFYLVIWILGIIAIGSFIGYTTKPEINTWYKSLNRSSLTPPNYVFPIAWSILYSFIGACGWLIWHYFSNLQIKTIKNLYIMQLLLNWSWTPVFFSYHFIGASLVILLAMDIIVSMIICLTYKNMKIISLLMIPYLLWLSFATYLSFYIWLYN